MRSATAVIEVWIQDAPSALAAVLFNGGISFGGVVSFLFADLIIIPILVIYRRYYGTRMMLTLLGGFYATMAAGGCVVELLFSALGLVPAHGHARTGVTGIMWNYTTYLNIVAFALTIALVWRFFASGGREMLAMMGGRPDSSAPDSDDGGVDERRASATPT